MEEEFTQLNYKYTFHLILAIIIIITHIIFAFYIQWPNKNILYIFIYSSIFIIIYLIICIIQWILIKRKQLKSKLKIHIILGKIFVKISIIFGIFFTILIIINTVLVKAFCLECPFNLSDNSLNVFFQGNQEESEINNKCNKRRCILNKDNPNSIYQYESRSK